MIELEVYAAGVRDLNKILELDHELETIAGLRYKVDSNHDPPSRFAKYEQSFANSDSIRGSSVPFRRSSARDRVRNF
jgi:hypothetical protein